MNWDTWARDFNVEQSQQRATKRRRTAPEEIGESYRRPRVSGKRKQGAPKPKKREIIQKLIAKMDIPIDGFPTPPPDSPYCEHKGTSSANLIITFDAGVKLDTRQVVLWTHGELTPEFTGVICRMQNPPAAAIIFSTGRHLLLGTRNLHDAVIVASRLVNLYNVHLAGTGKRAVLKSLVPRNVVCHAQLGPFDLRAFAQQFNSHTQYDDKTFIGATLSVRVDTNDVTNRSTVAVLFGPGKIVLTGARSSVEHQEMFEKICVLFQHYRVDLPECKQRWDSMASSQMGMHYENVKELQEFRKQMVAVATRTGTLDTLLQGQSCDDFLAMRDVSYPKTPAQDFWLWMLNKHYDKTIDIINRYEKYRAHAIATVKKGRRKRKRYRPAPGHKQKPTPVLMDLPDSWKNDPEILRLQPKEGYLPMFNVACAKLDVHPNIADDREWAPARRRAASRKVKNTPARTFPPFRFKPPQNTLPAHGYSNVTVHRERGPKPRDTDARHRTSQPHRPADRDPSVRSARAPEGATHSSGRAH